MRVARLDEATAMAISVLSREMKYFHRIRSDNPSSMRARASLSIASDAGIHQNATREVFRDTLN